MATQIPRVIADLELQLATALAIGGTSFTLSSATDDDGEALPAGIYVFAVDSGTSNKEYILGQLNDLEVTGVKSVSRQGVQTSGTFRAHRVGAPVILTNFAALQLVADTLRGGVDLDAGTPLSYDGEPTLNDNNQLATVGYVLATVTGGDVSFDKQTIAGTGGADIVAGNLVYFDESDQEWYLCDGETAATLEGVMRGIALGSGSDGVAITGGVHLAGAWTTSGLTAGEIYYASDTDGALATTAGTVTNVVGVALSTTRLWVIPQHRETMTRATKDALAGGGDFGTPSGTNKFVTEEAQSSPTTAPQIVTFTSSGTWTKDAGLKYIIAEVIGGGGGGGGADYNPGSDSDDGSGGGGGGYSRKLILASALGATETVTVGTGGAGAGATGTAGTGVTSSLGAHLSATGGTGGTVDADAPGGVGGIGSSGDLNSAGDCGEMAVQILASDDRGGGAGGGSYMGGGAQAKTTGGNGNVGRAYGGGGGGAHSEGGDRTGGAGAPGIVIVTEYYS